MSGAPGSADDLDPDTADRNDPNPMGVPLPRRSDPERGFRGVMSGALLLQSITVLLGLPVAASDHQLRPWELVLVLGLAAACIVACAYVKKRWIVPAILALQLAAVCTWFVHPALGIMGVIFAVAWWTLLHFRNEYRRRLAAGELPSQQAESSAPD